MKINLIIVFCLTYLLSIAQEEAYYLNGYPSKADLLLVDTDFNVVKEAYSFKHNVNKLNVDDEKELIGNLNHLLTPKKSNQPMNDSLYLKLFYTLPIDTNWVDSLKVSGKWYKIHIFYADDKHMGGRMNYARHTITVSDIGVIFNHSNTAKYCLLMLNHKDETKHKALIEIYKYLRKYSDILNAFDYNLWHNIGNLTQKYSFKDCPSVLINRWSDARKSFEIVSHKSDTTGSEIRYTVTIKNVSGTRCLIPKGHFGPSKAILHYEDSVEDMDLLDKEKSTSYYRRLRNSNFSKYLEPNEETTFTTRLPGMPTCRICKYMAFSGFHIKYPYNRDRFNDLFYWMKVRALEGEGITVYPPGKMK